MPEMHRTTLKEQIADRYRQQITSGELAGGDRLPSVLAIARDWEVSSKTAASAVSLLQVEGLVYTSPMGTFVASDEVLARTPGDRIKVPGFTRPAPSGEDTAEVTSAHIVVAPEYVASVTGLTPGSSIVRREEITTRPGGARKMLAVDWIPDAPKILAAGLTDPEPIPGGPEALIREVTGRRITRARDSIRARSCDAREARALHLPVGTPVLAGVHVWSDDQGVVLYGEWVMPPDQVVSYAYDVDSGA